MLNLAETAIARLDPASTILEDFKKKVDAISKVAGTISLKPTPYVANSKMGEHQYAESITFLCFGTQLAKC